MKKIIYSISTFGLLLLLLFLPTVVEANNSWNNYHWPRSKNPFNLTLGDNLSAQWDSYLSSASYDWGRSSRFDTKIVQGRINATTCKGSTANIQVCNASYGTTGWLGLAQLGVNGDHISYASVKLNDTYFTMSRYNTSAWKRLVMCQEIGHALGLDHQDENFNNKPLGTCMDYTSDPTPNQRPNMADYYTLLDVYRHLDTGIAEGTAIAVDDTSIAGGTDEKDWGKLVTGTDRRGGSTTLANDTSHVATFEKDLGNGKKVNTVVIWAQE